MRGCGGASFGICVIAVSMRFGAPSRNAGTAAATTSEPTAISTRAEQLLGPVALPTLGRGERGLHERVRLLVGDLVEHRARLRELRLVRRMQARGRRHDLRLQRPQGAEQLVLLARADVELVERGREVANQRVELFIHQLHAGVRALHIAAAVVTGPAGRHAHLLDEQRLEPRNVGVAEAQVDAPIGRDAIDKIIDDRDDRTLTAEPVVERLRGRRSRRRLMRRRLRGRRRPATRGKTREKQRAPHWNKLR